MNKIMVAHVAAATSGSTPISSIKGPCRPSTRCVVTSGQDMYNTLRRRHSGHTGLPQGALQKAARFLVVVQVATPHATHLYNAAAHAKHACHQAC